MNVVKKHEYIWLVKCCDGISSYGCEIVTCSKTKKTAERLREEALIKNKWAWKCRIIKKRIEV
jgi:hypothetical protein